ncbi:MAG: hypothetical protein LBQ87_05540 [Candidatus Fibromonas sp.]|jgi:hypothetical protein|nr:hypothetical protein [Candidatus Fibromonas sp.]
MNIVDSSLWVEYFLEHDIDRVIIDTIKDAGKLYVPSICLYEVYKKFLSVNDIEKANLAVDIIEFSPKTPTPLNHSSYQQRNNPKNLLNL